MDMPDYHAVNRTNYLCFNHYRSMTKNPKENLQMFLQLFSCPDGHALASYRLVSRPIFTISFAMKVANVPMGT